MDILAFGEIALLCDAQSFVVLDKHLAALILLASFLRFCFHIKQIAKCHLTTPGNPSKIFVATNVF